MVTLHAHRWRLGAELYRETTDVDVGFQKLALSNLDTAEALSRLGYKKIAGNISKPIYRFPMNSLL